MFPPLKQMAKDTIDKFPTIPDSFEINPHESHIRVIREEMAATILTASGTY